MVVRNLFEGHLLKIYLLVELNESRFEVFCDVLARGMVLENALAVTLALLVLLGDGGCHRRPRQRVQRNLLVLRVSDLLEFVVGNAFVGNVRGVVRRNKTGEFREVGSHYHFLRPQFINL